MTIPAGSHFARPLTVRPMVPTAVTLSPTAVVGGQPTTGTVKLECKAGPGPVTVALSSSNDAVAHPVAPTVVVPQGVQTATFAVATNTVLAKSSATIRAAAHGVTRSKLLTANPAASVSPTSLKFGNVVVNTTSGALNATLTNKGVAAFTVNGIALTGSNAGYYTQTHDCPANLAAGASCTVTVSFAPTVSGSRSAKLTIATSATSTPLSVSLSGTGVAPP